MAAALRVTPTPLTGEATALGDMRGHGAPSSSRRGGRIGGVWSSASVPPFAMMEALHRALGASARTLGVHAPAGGPTQLAWKVDHELRVQADAPTRPVEDQTIADFDACTIDGVQLADLHPVRDRIHEIDGAFALASYCARDDSLCLSGDPIGHRSLYYAQRDDTVVFASTLAAVLASGLVPPQLDPALVPFFLTFAYVPGERTLARGVLALPAGTRLVIGRAGLRLEPFWKLPGEAPPSSDEGVLRERLRSALQDAVQRMLPEADHALGATLSGGIDSSLVLALARRQHPGGLRAYSVSFGREYPNELEFSAQVAAHCGVAQTVVEVRPEHIETCFDRTIGALSVPNGDPLTVPNAMLFARAAQDTNVVLNGEGGDPCFGGPKNTSMMLGELFGDGNDTHDPFARERRYLRAHQKCYDDLAAMLAPDLAALLDGHEMEQLAGAWLGDAKRTQLLDRLMAINVTFKGAHHILPKVEQLSFASSVLPRSPLFDRRIVEFSFRVPANYKRRGAVEKYLLKRAVDDLLPRAIVERPKSGMLVPVEAWFRGPLLRFARERLLEGLAPRGLFQRRWLEDLLDAKLGGLRPRRGVKIWLLLTLESWLRMVLDRAQEQRRIGR
jgi:asparagine synthase (glutamine-hydrolysing)